MLNVRNDFNLSSNGLSVMQYAYISVIYGQILVFVTFKQRYHIGACHKDALPGYSYEVISKFRPD